MSRRTWSGVKRGVARWGVAGQRHFNTEPERIAQMDAARAQEAPPVSEQHHDTDDGAACATCEPALPGEDAEAAWLEARRGCVGASESAALFGAHHYLSPYALYCRKRGLVPDDIGDEEAAAWGKRLEPAIADWYAETSGRVLVDHGRHALRLHLERPYLGATLDREIVAFDERGPGALEIKTADPVLAHEWEEGPPLAYQIQVQHQLAVTGWTWGVIVVSLGRRNPLVFEVARNDEFIEVLLEECEAFWRRVTEGDPPDVDGHPATGRALKALYPTDSGETIDLPAEAAKWDGERTALLKEKKGIEARLDALDNNLRAAIGAASFARLPGGGSYSLMTVAGGPVAYTRADYRKLARRKK